AQIVTQLVIKSVSCAPPILQKGALAALETREKSIPPMLEEFRRRREIIINGLNQISGVRCQKPRGTFYAFPNVSSFGKTSKQIADYLLNDGGVACLPGTAFGREGEGYIRISFATSMENICKGLERLAKAFIALPRE
ncbi:MAG: aminotransferase class I/II-fold pyridoxal phosphate-dependent enzyme, partial [Acidobacteria bacterium]|nr:aminotransferase class I/II-fold pyridoxal phosphate-dependent enzyme [Acidobacteriota bacterium]